jgi:glutathione S-transferase
MLSFGAFHRSAVHVLKLFYAQTSPFSRKTRIVLAEKKIECQLVEQSPWDADSPIVSVNPLGKVPVLMLDDGTTLFDSRVIVEYLDNVSPVSRLIPEPSRQRMEVRRWEALADGICEAAVAVVLEKRRPAAKQSADFIERQQAKVDRGVAEMARELDDRGWCNGEAYSLADVAAGCALGYLDLRQPQLDWRGEYPNLAKHAEKLAKRPSFADTAPPSS